jgi:hypothetical protein
MVWIEKFSWVQLRPPRAPGKEAFLLMGYALFQWNVHFTLPERTRVPNPSPSGQWLEVGFGPSIIGIYIIMSQRWCSWSCSPRCPQPSSERH